MTGLSGSGKLSSTRRLPVCGEEIDQTHVRIALADLRVASNDHQLCSKIPALDTSTTTPDTRCKLRSDFLEICLWQPRKFSKRPFTSKNTTSLSCLYSRCVPAAHTCSYCVAVSLLFFRSQCTHGAIMNSGSIIVFRFG